MANDASVWVAYPLMIVGGIEVWLVLVAGGLWLVNWLLLHRWHLKVPLPWVFHIKYKTK